MYRNTASNVTENKSSSDDVASIEHFPFLILYTDILHRQISLCAIEKRKIFKTASLSSRFMVNETCLNNILAATLAHIDVGCDCMPHRALRCAAKFIAF